MKMLGKRLFPPWDTSASNWPRSRQRKRVTSGLPWLPLLPIGAFDMIRQHDTLYRQIVGQGDFKCVTFQLVGDWTDQTKSDLFVVGSWRQYQCRSATGLFMAHLRRK